MRAVKSKDTKPELIVRRLLHSMGLRFRLHRRNLPGAPDIVLRKHNTVILAHGCFWHGHHCARGARQPKSYAEYWRAKIARNAARDERTLKVLEPLGWCALVLWECELSAPGLKVKLDRWFGR
jgi:DNA mismatch endonuclease (patch repair protein)